MKDCNERMKGGRKTAREKGGGVVCDVFSYSCMVAILDYLGHWEILKGWGWYI